MTALDALHRCRAAWQKTQDQLDIYSVLRAEADGADPAASPLGLCSEDAARSPSFARTDGSRIDPLCGRRREHAAMTPAGFGPAASSTDRQHEETA